MLRAHLQTGGFHKATLPAWQRSPVAVRRLPPAAQPQAQPGGASLAKFMPPATRPPTQILAHLAIRLPYPMMDCESGPLLGQEERRTFPGTKMGTPFLAYTQVFLNASRLLQLDPGYSWGESKRHTPRARQVFIRCV